MNKNFNVLQKAEIYLGNVPTLRTQEIPGEAKPLAEATSERCVWRCRLRVKKH